MSFVRLAVLPLSRFFISAVFLAGALKNIFSWEETERGLIDALSDWQANFAYSQEVQAFFAFMISWSSVLLLIATGVMLLGGIFVLMGVKERFGLSLLAIFLVPATILYHPFWWVEGPFYEMESAMFLKNLAILGCLLKLLFRDSAEQSASSMGDSISSMRF